MSSQRKHKRSNRSRHAIVTRSLRTAASALVVLALAASVFGASPARADASTRRCAIPSYESGLASAGSLAHRGQPATPPAHRARWFRAPLQRNPLAEQPTHQWAAAASQWGLASPVVVSPDTSKSPIATLLHFSSKASRTRGHPVQG